MELTKIAPVDPMPIDPAAPGGQAGPAPRQEGAPLPAAAAPADRADIHPLDVPAAMRILIAEIRAGLDLPVAADGPGGWAGETPGAGALPQAPMQTARLSIQLLLDALPAEDADPAADAAAVAGVELDFRTAMDRALEAIANWPEVPKAVIDAVVEATQVATQVATQLATPLTEDPTTNPLWLRPEWMGLLPGIRAYRRRRRTGGLSDPDFGPLREEEIERPVDADDPPRRERP